MYDKGGTNFKRPRVFCASLADWLDDEVDIMWLSDLLVLIHKTPNLDWLLLTKRPEHFSQRLEDVYMRSPDEAASGIAYDWGRGALIPANIWIGTSVEDQERADLRIRHLVKIPAKVRFLSVEPMLGSIDFSPRLISRVPVRPGYEPVVIRSIDWAIFGGESGHKARPCDIRWIRDGVAQCRVAGVAPFVKQLGSDPLEGVLGLPIKDKKGGDMSEWPEDLRVREFPV